MFLQIVNKTWSLICLNNKKSIRAIPFSRNIFISRLLNMKIGTHDGIFHCDEVLACFMLKRLPEYKDAEIIRTRDMEKLNECDIVVDVGGVFNHETKRYDHHQREFVDTLSTLKPEMGDQYKIRLSSAGLIYTFYGERLIQDLAPKSVPLSKADLTTIFKQVYENLMEEIDGIDNGVPMTDEKPKYQINTNISARVARLNPKWNSDQTFDVNEIFNNAMQIVGEEFLYIVNNLISVWLPARDYVRNALEDRDRVHQSGQIIEFTEFVPWKEHLFTLETEIGIQNLIKYVIVKDKNNWRIMAVPVTPKSFILRKPLLKKWCGLRDEKLSEESGIPGCIFCHNSGFVGGNKTREGALLMAEYSLAGNDEKNGD